MVAVDKHGAELAGVKQARRSSTGRADQMHHRDLFVGCVGSFVSRNQKPADFKNYVSESQTKIETAIKAANIKPE